MNLLYNNIMRLKVLNLTKIIEKVTKVIGILYVVVECIKGKIKTLTRILVF